MNKWIKRLGFLVIVLLLSIIALLHVAESAIYMSDDEVRKVMPDYEVQQINTKYSTLRLVGEKKRDSTLILFIHGAPGGWDAWKKYLQDEDLRHYGRLVSIDRLGYGGSDHTPFPSIIDQVQAISEIIRNLEIKNVYVIGHSYGGAISAYLAHVNNEKTKGVLMVAPLIDPNSEPIFWYSYFAHWKLTKWLLPSSFQVAGAEKFGHSDALKDIESIWSKLTIPVHYIHGYKDGLAPPQENIDFAKSRISNKNLNLHVYPNEGHLIIWENYNEVKRILLNMLDDS